MGVLLYPIKYGCPTLSTTLSKSMGVLLYPSYFKMVCVVSYQILCSALALFVNNAEEVALFLLYLNLVHLNLLVY